MFVRISSSLIVSARFLPWLWPRYLKIYFGGCTDGLSGINFLAMQIVFIFLMRRAAVRRD